jgi:hypothetical protein
MGLHGLEQGYLYSYKKTRYMFATKTNRLMGFVEGKIVVYSENYMRHTHKIVGKRKFFLMLKQVVYIVTTVLRS